MEEISEEDKKKRKISLGPAELRPFEEEKGAYALYRPVYVDGWDDSIRKFVRISTNEPIGPLAVFRPASKNESVDMRTFDPISKKEIQLHCIWDPSGTFLRKHEQ